ncbi:general substrate transporter [Plectosphaerella cucumerina]|uniref:General substrate transporter n=1 Tax=Plectosphaerella cucumerina TaxID=40658 RepID=A0A8K0TR29_9PEZI|nr:general substrate transporter [Plectosphaerella cucumerina]
MAVLYIAVINFGFDMSVTNTTLGMPSFRKYFGYESAPGVYRIKSTYQSAWAGGTFAGQILMDIPAGFIADRYGRKFCLTLSVVVIIIASTIQITAVNIGMIIAGKTVFGMGVGLMMSYLTSYTAELASPRLRGIACMAVNFCIQGGMWVGSGAALGLTTLFPDVDDARSFRYIFAFQYLFAGIYLAGCWWLAESPVFHVHREQYDKAEAVIRKLYGPDYDSKRHLAFLVKTSAVEQRLRSAGHSISYRELFKGRNVIRMFISACIIWPILMGTGFWPAYQTYYFELAGAKNPQAMNYGCTSVAIGTSIIAYFLIEPVGRRKLWIIGAAGMTISNLIGGFMWIPFNNGNRAIAGRVATAMVFIWNGFYDIGPANMGYAITSEVPSSRMRIKNNAFVHVFSHLTGFVVSLVVPFLYNDDASSAGLGLRMGFIWAAFGIVFVVWAFFFVPNLAGMNAFEIDQLFESGVPVRKFHHAKFDEHDQLIRSSIPGQAASEEASER